MAFCFQHEAGEGAGSKGMCKGCVEKEKRTHTAIEGDEEGSKQMAEGISNLSIFVDIILICMYVTIVI